MPNTPLDALFEPINDRLEEALEIATASDRNRHLALLARNAEVLHHLTFTPLVLAAPPQQNPLD